MLGGFLLAASLPEGTRRGRCWLNMEQPSWKSGLQALRAVRGGGEVKEQVCSWQQGLELKKLLESFFETESLLQLVLSRAGCSSCCDSEGVQWGCRALAVPGWACEENTSPGKAALGFKSARPVL